MSVERVVGAQAMVLLLVWLLWLYPEEMEVVSLSKEFCLQVQ